MDEATYRVLDRENLSNVRLIRLADFEVRYRELVTAKPTRSRIEFYFTCTPFLPDFVLKENAHVNMVTYLDADLYFFEHPKEIFEEIADKSIAIVEHRFPDNIKHKAVHGIYNVGWLSFRNDQYGLAALTWWKAKCVDWCYDRVEETRFADQKYLDDWTDRFEGVIVLQHKGANLAPWNVTNYRLSKKDTSVFADDDKLICYHFHGLKKITNKLYKSNLTTYKADLSNPILKEMYRDYIDDLETLGDQFYGSQLIANRRDIRKMKQSDQKMREGLIGRMKTLLSIAYRVVTGIFSNDILLAKRTGR